METENLGMRMFGIGRAIQAFDGPDSDMEPHQLQLLLLCSKMQSVSL